MNGGELPLWLRWFLSLTVAAGLVIALVIFVGRNPRGDQGATAQNVAGAAEANREGQIVTAQDQAPHQAVLPQSLPASVALERAIAADMRNRVATHDLAGPVRAVTCKQLASRNATSLSFRCGALAGNFSYPFAGVADLSTHKLTWCKNDSLAVDPGLQVPLSRACTR